MGVCEVLRRYDGVLLFGELGPQVRECEIKSDKDSARIKLSVSAHAGAKPVEIDGRLKIHDDGSLTCVEPGGERCDLR